MHPVQVIGPNARGQAVTGIIAYADSFLLALEGNDRKHWPENLLLGKRHVVPHVGKDRWLDEQASGQIAVACWLAASDQRGTLPLCYFDIVEDQDRKSTRLNSS